MRRGSVAGMEWSADVSAGDWLRAVVDDPWRGTMHDVVPRGFPAYARIFHPATRDRPVGRPWPPLPSRVHRREWEAFQADAPEVDVERVSWAETAAAMGTVFHAGAQWHRLVAPGVIERDEDGPRDAAGWRYGDPALGQLDADVLAGLARVLSQHTNDPDDGWVALWEGWGGLLGAHAVSPAHGVPLELPALDRSGAVPTPEHHEQLLARSIRNPFNDAFRKPTWQPGILPDDVSRGPRLELPGRAHVMFRGGVAQLADDGWVTRVPWRDLEAERQGFPLSAHSPSLVWPADRSWIVASDVDWDSTIVAGGGDLIAAICADPSLEARSVPEGASLQWDADDRNR